MKAAEKSGRVPASNCPACQSEHDAASHPTNETAVPGPGDLTVCIDCGALLRFGQGLELEAVSPAELRALDAGTRGELVRVQSAIRLLHRGEA